jgi:5-methylcytosine-specific restriction endonuclease McrA
VALPNRKITGPPPAEKMHYVTLKFSGEEYARWERLVESARQGGGLNRAILDGLGGKGGEGPETFVVIMNCPECGKAVHPSSRGELEIPKPALEAGLCDAILEDPQGNRRRMVAPRMRRLAFQRARYSCEAPGCGNASFLQIHHRRPVAGAGANDLENLVVLCSRCHRNLHEEEKEAREALRKAP